MTRPDAREGRGPDDVVVRPAEPGDLDALVALEERVFPTDRLDRRNFRHQLRSPTITLLVAARGGDLLGYATVMRRRGSRLAHLASIAVAESGRGLGARLLQAAEAEALRAGCDRIRLEVRADNVPAQRLYDRAGYHRFATERGYYEDGADAHRYERPLTEPGEGG